VSRLLAFALLVPGTALAFAAYWAQTDALHSPNHAAAQVAVAGAFVVSGILAWARRPQNRMGGLMVIAGFALLARQLRYSDSALEFTVFFILGDFAYAMVGHATLAYPTGRVADRWERALVVAGYTTVLVFPLLAALFYDGSRPLIGFDARPRDSLVNITGDAHVVELLQKAEIVLFFGILASLFIVLVVRRYWRASPRMRRILAPLLLAAVAFGLRAIFECVFTFVNRPFAYNNLFWWQVTAFFLLPLALLVGLLRAHLARVRVGDLVLELEHTQPSELRDALARSLGDSNLEVAFWLPERQTYADAAGVPVELPDGEDRAVAKLEHDGQPLAALVYDPSLLEEPELVGSVGAAARLALENAQLQAEARAQLAQVKESRKRIVTAGDEERKRIERDLHDGAQQRLSALVAQLRTAQLRLGASEADPAIDALLESAVVELQAANEELRELVRGVYPAILTDEGLAAAVESLAVRTPLPVELDVVEGRFPAQVEATAYFVTCESLNNVLKHAHASGAVIRISEIRRLLHIEVVDDGVGGARPAASSGLSGLEDRVEALGGSLRVESAEGLGTRVVAEIPCGS
jgi:signal transduction histidine kinase